MKKLFILIMGVLPAQTALAQNAATVPNRQIPPSVITELRVLENRFELALSQDCASERCFPKGCTYGEHTVADRPESTSLPGLGQDQGPGSVNPQPYLTLARCSFAHERSVRSRDVQALIKRLQSKLSKGWLTVEVQNEVLQPIPKFLSEAPEEKPKEEVAPVEEEPEPALEDLEPRPWDWKVAARELWLSLLPHFSWMIALIMVTLAAMILLWAWRRLGKESPEEQALLAKMLEEPQGLLEEGEAELAEEPDGDGNGSLAEPVVYSALPDPDESYVREQREAWQKRLANVELLHGDASLQELITTWLRNSEMGLLAKAVLMFPHEFPRAFPADGELAAAKLAFADYLKHVNRDALPSDAEFFTTLNQHALSSSLASQKDAEAVRSLRDEFGASGIARVAEELPPRYGALLFALTPAKDQQEVARLLASGQRGYIAEQLLRSNRMDRSETDYLLRALHALKSDEPLPAPPSVVEVSDRGPVFDAAGALSILLPQMDTSARSQLFESALQRFHGAFPGWYSDILFGDMLLRLQDEALADLLLSVDATALSAWIKTQPQSTQESLRAVMPNALKTTLMGRGHLGSEAERLELVRRGRLELAKAFQSQLARNNLGFENVLT